MDHMMTLMDGRETTQKLRALGYKGIIVGLTANALVGNDEMFKQNGFDDFISKPIDMRQLNDCLNKYVRDHHQDMAAHDIQGFTGMADKLSANKNDHESSSKLLEVFRRDAEKAVVTLREISQQVASQQVASQQAKTTSEGIKLFTTTVHAMKAALANIGENEASEIAFALEKAGLNGDKEFIATETGPFIEKLEDLISSISQTENQSDPSAQADADTIEDMALLKEQLQNILSACESFDRKAAFAALDLLKEKQWKTETAAMLENIHETLHLHSDFEGAAEIIVYYFRRTCQRI
jgi:CheY-like chemotaxis protein